MKKVSFYIKSVNHTKQLQLLLFIFTHTGPLKIFMKTRKDKWTTWFTSNYTDCEWDQLYLSIILHMHIHYPKSI